MRERAVLYPVTKGEIGLQEFYINKKIALSRDPDIKEIPGRLLSQEAVIQCAEERKTR
jgi:hypothetical protein